MATKAFNPKGLKVLRGGIGGVPILEIVNLDMGEGKSEFDDATNMDSVGGFKEWIATTLESGEPSFTFNFLGNADASQTQMLADFNAQSLLDWAVTLPNNLGSFTFSAYVSGFGVKLAHDKKADGSAKLKVVGPVVFA